MMHHHHWGKYLVIFAALLFAAAFGARIPPTVAAAADNVIVTTPDDTQNFWNAFGTANVNMDEDGKWASVLLTQNWKNQAGAITLNNRLDLSQPFNIEFGANFGYRPSVGVNVGDGISFALYPGQLGAIGMFGGNLGVGAIPFAVGFKMDPYLNTWNDNGNSSTTYADLASRLGVTLPSNIDPLTDTVKLTELFRNANPLGNVVYGPTDDQIYYREPANKIAVPYGAFIQTSRQGRIEIPQIAPGQSSVSDPGFYGGSIYTPPMPFSYNYVLDAKWHGMKIDYTVSSDGKTGTLAIRLYSTYHSNRVYNEASFYDDRNGELLQKWTRTIEITKVNSMTGQEPYFAMNIAASTGQFFLTQQIKNLYASYTPEPGSVTSRYVDENGKSIAAAVNKSGAKQLGDEFTIPVLGTIHGQVVDPNINPNTAKPVPEDVTYVYDYTTYEGFNQGTNAKVIQRILPVATAPGTLPPEGALVGSADYTYHATFKAPYQSIVTHYKRVQSQPTIATGISVQGKDTEQTPVGTSGHDFLNKVTLGNNTKMNYTFKVTVPATGPNPWKGVTLTVKVPQGFTVSPTGVTAAALSGTTATSATPTITRSSDPSSQAAVITISGVNLTGLLKDAGGTVQPNTLLVTLPLTATGATTGTIRATLDDTYLMDYTSPAETDAQKKTNYYTGYPVTYTNAINEVEPDIVSNVWIPLSDRAAEKHDFTAADLHMPVGVVLNAAGSIAYFPVNDTPPAHTVRLTAQDITPAAVTGSANLLGGFTLTDSGIKKLRANDYVQAAFQFTGTNGTKTTQWQVDYNLYEPLTTWMPDTGLQQLVRTAFAQPVTIDANFISGGTAIANTLPAHPADQYPGDELRKSDMSALRALTNAAPTIGHPHDTAGTTTWNLRNDPTGLEYAANLQALAIYGDKLLANPVTANRKTDGTFRSLLPILPKSLVTLDLSGYDRRQDVFAYQPATLPQTTLTFPKLTNFNLVADELVPADLQEPAGNGQYSDISAFYTANLDHLTQTNLSSFDEPAKLSNPQLVNQLAPIMTAGNTALTINQHDMLIASAVNVTLTNTTGQLMMTLPLTALKTMDQQMIGGAGTSALPTNLPITMTAYDLARSDEPTANGRFTTFFAGNGSVPYSDYTGTSVTQSGSFYILRTIAYTAAGATTHYSSWTPAGIQALTAMAVTPDHLDFGKRHLRAGDFANTGYDETSSTTPEAAEGTPVTITVTQAGGPAAASGQLTAAASPFVSGTSTMANWHLRFTDTAEGTTFTVPANSTTSNNNPITLSPITFPAATPETGTSAYHVRLVVPDTTGIQTGQEKYTANLVYTYMPNTL
ncbi:lectin-like domain-containing protein [Schleiferilactobacillus shenzhenensis]|uniref:SraP n=1 Tax=Schleiferilactobacillus shenzhenensis LY-73 TaxID=1231336 RepID=U4TQH6_9LACO|nr:SraP [Schleiferilactobacillus shenzhenensis]ERL64158.1 SraP [Schleiferilactobacillus shenzhenensis LY-73]